ncbi:fungal-specific transcription factor domain-containing protein [Aspergillus karnatakaensis]|uniref:Zn(II)2Cys6 transcription factor n=1 Tax=Aspergillus karnatakaensis TaxID=1810916 RepID=UPI003CCD6847
MESTVTESGGPIPSPLHPERRRNGCTECRRKKVKCDLRSPNCSRCHRFPRECKYESRFIARRRSVSKSSETPAEPQALVQASSSPYPSKIQSRLSIQALVSETTTVVFPLASRSFLDRLLSAAMETPHLLYALLASSDSHARRRMASHTESDQTALQFTNDAIAGLRTALSDGRGARQRVEMAMTAMALSTNDVCNGNLDVFRMHLQGVRGMLASGLLNSGNSHSQGDSFAVYLFKWFAALDVSAGLSLFHRSSLLSGDLYASSREILDRTSDGYNEYVDDVCGYSLALLPILAEIGELARQRAEALETQIHSLPQPRASVQERSEVTEAELRTSHSAFIHTALLHLHRRVQLLPKHHPTVRDDVRCILSTICRVRPFSTANILLLWPIFTAGCETDDLSERGVIDGRMGNMQAMGMGNFTRAREVLNRFWQANTDLRWDVYLAESGVDLVLF